MNCAQAEIAKRQVSVLIQLEQNNPGLSQLINISPSDMATIGRNRLADDECIVQYIPTMSGLKILFISKKRIAFKEDVKIDAVTLMDSVMSMVNQLSGRGTPVRITQINNVKKNINPALMYLYDVLIGPVVKEMKGYEKVFIIPAGKLFYLPFASLAHYDSQNNIRYLIEDYNIGFLSSMYLFDLIYNYKQSNNGQPYLFSDPDGSLPFARNESEGIKAQLINSIEYKGKNASVKNLMNISDKCKILHLATHGHLEKGSIDKSWLQFSDQKLRMNEIIVMQFPNTEMVVLSTCESALGVDGIEYATLARAFNNAGVPTVVSTLWEVNDESTKEIMIDFYKNIQSGMNKFSALQLECIITTIHKIIFMEQHRVMISYRDRLLQ